MRVIVLDWNELSFPDLELDPQSDQRSSWFPWATSCRSDTYVCSLSGFWPVQSLDGTRMRLLLCLEPLCRCGHSRGPCSCSSFHLCSGQQKKGLQKVSFLFSTPTVHSITSWEPSQPIHRALMKPDGDSLWKWA